MKHFERLDAAFAEQFGCLPPITPPACPTDLAATDCTGLLLGNADIEMNNREAIYGLFSEEITDDQ
jgi:hypothetical protein